MSPAWVWFWNNVDWLIPTVVTPLLTWGAHLLLASKKRVDKLIQNVNKMAMVFQPDDGPNLAETLQVMASTQQAIMTDIKQLKNGQQSMVARQRADLEDEPDPVFEADLNGQVVFANTAYLDLVGYSVAQMRGRGWEVIIHPSDRARIATGWRDAVAGRRIFDETFQVISRAQRVTLVRCIAKPLICEANEITGFRGRYYTNVSRQN